MFKQKSRKSFYLILTLFILFQLTANTYGNVKYSESLNFDAEKSYMIFLTNIAQTDINVLTNEINKKQSFLIVLAIFYRYGLNNYFAGIAKTKLPYLQSLIDYREEIRQTIPNYFNGSKYKLCTLFF